MATDRAMATFGELLRRLRHNNRLSQEALAERAGMSRRAVSDLERGFKLVPHKDSLERLACALASAAATESEAAQPRNAQKRALRTVRYCWR